MSQKIAVSLLVFGVMVISQSAALSATSVQAETKAVSTTTRPATTRTATIGGRSVKIDTNRSSGSSARSETGVRSRSEVRSHRSAHSHARLDHSINRLNAQGLTTRASGQTRLDDMTTSDHGGFQTIIMTAGHEDHHSTAHHDHKKEERKDGKQSERKKGLFARLHHRKSRNENDRDIQQSGNQGIGDGSNASFNASSTVNDLNGTREMILHQGTAFIAHSRPVTVKTDRATVRIAPHSAVYIVSNGKSVAIYDIADHKDSDVKVEVSSDKKFSVKAGEQLLLAGKEDADFEKANPVPEIKTTRTRELGTALGTKIFNAEFSPIAALDHAEGFHELVNSPHKSDQALANHILKMAAIVLNLRSSAP